MNDTARAAGYPAGALALPHVDARRLFLGGCLGTVLLLALHGGVTGDGALCLLRFLTGGASAATFATGGLLAARIGDMTFIVSLLREQQVPPARITAFHVLPGLAVVGRWRWPRCCRY